MNGLRRIFFSSFTSNERRVDDEAGKRGRESRVKFRRATTDENGLENAWKRTFAAVLLLEHTRREFPEERDERPRRGRHWLIPGALILRQILKQVAVHHQRTPDANFPNRVDTHGDNLGSRPVVNELVHQLPEQRFQRVGGTSS